VSKVLRIEFLPKRPHNEEVERAKLADEFKLWEAALPLDLTYTGFGPDKKSGVWVIMLHITLKYKLLSSGSYL
jgi:hypothetical protein